jgi:hypothetical protein
MAPRFERERRSDSEALMWLVAATVLVIGCSGEEKPTPTPTGSAVTDAVFAHAPVMIGAGDIAVCGTSGDEATAAIVDSVLRADSADKSESVVSLLRPDSAKKLESAVVFTLGDNAYPSGDVNDFPRCFSPSWGSPRIMRAIRPAPGNHDYATGTAATYFRYFGERAGPSGKGYYSYDFAGWHIISLNSEILSRRSVPAANAQESWLRQDLKDHPALCTLAYFHRPLFSSGSHGPSAQVQSLWQILYNAGADLILSGHDHHYERFRPQTPSGAYDPINGIEEIIVGTGGGELRGVRDTPAQNSIVQIHGHFGVLKLMLGSGEYGHAFLDTHGRVWDSGGRKCH